MIKEVNSPDGINLVSLFAGQAEQALNACVSLQRQVILWQGRAEGFGRLNEELQNEVGKLQAQCKRLDREDAYRGLREKCDSLRKQNENLRSAFEKCKCVSLSKDLDDALERVTFLQSDQKIRAADQDSLRKDLADVKRTLEKRDAELANLRAELQAEKENAPLNALRGTIADLEFENGKLKEGAKTLAGQVVRLEGLLLEAEDVRRAVGNLHKENKGLRDENASLKVSAEKYQNHAEHLKAQNEAVESKVQRLEEERQKLSAQVESMKVCGVCGCDTLSPEKVEELFTRFLELQKLGKEEISRLVALYQIHEEKERVREACETLEKQNDQLRADNGDLQFDNSVLKSKIAELQGFQKD